jgi:DNA-binding IclR family transcriptional regulator
MEKGDLLDYLASGRAVLAVDIARAFEVSYATAGMALLRLVRQGLVDRCLDEQQGVHSYRLSHKGQLRRRYFHGR